ncbi:MAG: hypothetical protein ACXW2R_05095 [Candidatus Aminicenantales bacterium]
MEGHELLVKITKVEAPTGFEEKVLAQLPAARKERVRARRAVYRYACAGSTALVLACFFLFRPSPPEKDAVLSYAERDALTAAPGKGTGVPPAGRTGLVPVYETMDYASEFRNAKSQRATIYILEQVSEIPSSEIIY